MALYAVISTMTSDSYNYAFPFSGPMGPDSNTAVNASYASPYADLASSAADLSTITQTQSSTITVTRNSQSNSSEGSPEQRTSSYVPNTILTLPCSDCSESATVVTGVMYATSEDLTTTITGEITSLVVVTLFRDDDYLIAPTEDAVPSSRSVTVDAVGGSSPNEASELSLEANLLLPSNYLVVSSEIYALVPPGSVLPYTPAWKSPVDSLNYMTENEDFSSLMPTVSSTNVDMLSMEPVSAEGVMLMWSSVMIGTLTSPSVTEMVGISTLVGPSSSVSDAIENPEDSETAETEASEETEEPVSVEVNSITQVSNMLQETGPVEESRIAEETDTSSNAESSINIETLTETGAPEETGGLETETEESGTDTIDVDVSNETETPDTDTTAVTDTFVGSDILNEIATSGSVNSETDVTDGVDTSVTSSIPDDDAIPGIDTPQTDAADLDTTEAFNPEANTSRVADTLTGTEISDESDFSTSNSPDVIETPESYITSSKPNAADTSFSVETDIPNSYFDIMDENYTADAVTQNETDMPDQVSTLDGMTDSTETDSSEESEVTEEVVSPDETVTFEKTDASNVAVMSQETEDTNLTATDIITEDSSETSLTDASESLRDTAILEETSPLAPIAETETSNTLVTSEDMIGSGETVVSAGPEVSEGLISSEASPSIAIISSLEVWRIPEAPETSERPASLEEIPRPMSSDVSGESDSDEEPEIITETRTPEETGLLRTSAVIRDQDVEATAETVSLPEEEAQTAEDSVISLEISISERSDSAGTPSSVSAIIEYAEETQEPSSSILEEISWDEDETPVTTIIAEPTENLPVSTSDLQSADASKSGDSDITSASTEAQAEGLLQSTGSSSEGVEVMTASDFANPTLTEIIIQPASDNMTILPNENELSSATSADTTILSTFISSIANAIAPFPSTAVEYMISQSMSDNSSFSSSIEIDTIGNSTPATQSSLVADANAPTSLTSPVASLQSTSTITRTAISTMMKSMNETMESTRLEASIGSMTVSNSITTDGDSSNYSNNNSTQIDRANTTDASSLSTSREPGPMGTGSVPAMYASGSLNSMEARSNMVVLSFSAAAMVFAQRWILG